MAICLVGILFYPFLFQPLHVIHHHGHAHEGHDCEHEHAHAAGSPDAGLCITEFSDNHCYICEFDLPANELPVKSQLGFVPHRYTEISPASSYSLMAESGYERTQPRAPPTVS